MKWEEWHYFTILQISLMCGLMKANCILIFCFCIQSATIMMLWLVYIKKTHIQEDTGLQVAQS